MIKALGKYMTSILLMQAIFTELHADCCQLSDAIGDLKENEKKNKVRTLYAKITGRSKEIGMNLQEVVHVFIAVEQKFLAMKDFA